MVEALKNKLLYCLLYSQLGSAFGERKESKKGQTFLSEIST